MTERFHFRWAEESRRQLQELVGRMRAVVQTRLEDGCEAEVHRVSVARYRETLAAWGSGVSPSTALQHLCAAFQLTSFERDVLILSAAVELDATLASQFSGGHPSFGFALASFENAHWTALAPDGPLRRHRLVSIERSGPTASAPIRMDEGLLTYLLGGAPFDERMAEVLEWVRPLNFLARPHLEMAGHVATLLRQSFEGSATRARLPVIQLSGQTAGDRRGVAARAAMELDWSLLILRSGDVPLSSAERANFVRAWARQVALAPVALMLEVAELREEERQATMALAEVVNEPLFVASSDPIFLRRPSVVRVELRRASELERADVWRRALPPDATCSTEALERVTAQFNGGAESVEAVASALRGQSANDESKQPLEMRLWDACRKVSRRHLEGLATRVVSGVGWEDLVLPGGTLSLLRNIVAQLRHRTRVYEKWGFGLRNQRGLGLNALFHGASGTGKTLAAEVIANELQLDLYRVDLSRLVSKYIGETEKNLRRVFDAAEESGAILLFDEADALFGKRSEVKDSHDRYANMEVSYLLSRTETYRGLAILTTNFRHALDSAFLRRIRFMINFPFPDAEQRAAIWRRAFPPDTPTRGLDAAKLAQLSVSGGSIRNVALGAAFLAADEGKPVTLAHVLEAAALEYSKLERSLGASETKGWF